MDSLLVLPRRRYILLLLVLVMRLVSGEWKCDDDDDKSGASAHASERERAHAAELFRGISRELQSPFVRATERAQPAELAVYSWSRASTSTSSSAPVVI